MQQFWKLTSITLVNNRNSQQGVLQTLFNVYFPHRQRQPKNAVIWSYIVEIRELCPPPPTPHGNRSLLEIDLWDISHIFPALHKTIKTLPEAQKTQAIEPLKPAKQWKWPQNNPEICFLWTWKYVGDSNFVQSTQIHLDTKSLFDIARLPNQFSSWTMLWVLFLKVLFAFHWTKMKFTKQIL